MSGETKFSVMCSLFNWIQKSKSSKQKRSKFRKFLDTYCKPSDYFAAVRLILPNLDRERGSYGLKESVLATCIIDALGMSRESADAVRLINWRKGGAKTGVNVGNFSLVASEVLQRRQGMMSGGLTIKELNDLLDRLASNENRAEKTSVLSDLIKKTNAQEMKWIVMIILKDLKLGISEKSIFHEFHPDAEDLFNVTCDLKLVCERLRDPHQRHKRQDIEVGKAVRPQLALRVANAASAWKKLHGKEVVMECKFDGDRIQIHKNGQEIHFFSRNFIDHSEYTHGMSNVIMENVLVDRCILDGEMLVWDTSTDRFAEFGSNQEIAKAAKEGLASERQLCYVAFDILYVGDTSVIHQSLKERHELLKKVVKPVKGRLEILVPDGGLNAHTTAGEPCWSRVARNVDDVDTFFKRTIENRDEGIVLKDLESKWEPSDRSGKWLKLKPDYVRAGSDLDVLIIGGYYGSGRRGGQVAQFLVGLAERPAPNTYPRRFVSFCRVGTGLSDEELDAVVNKLKPYFRKYEYPKKGPPSYYKVTNSSKERPDVWIDSPEKSIILSITSDIRTIRSEVFAAPYSLRFPRIDKVRDDKPWHECLDVESFVELVHSSNHTTQWGETQHENKSKRSKSSRTADKKSGSLVPFHLLQTDVSHIKGETKIFSNMMFYFANVPSTHSLDSLHKMVAENGGTFSMNLNNAVTHCIAAESRGIKFQAAKRHGDVIHYSWLIDCCSQKKLVPLQPKYFLVLSESSKKKLQEEIDEYSDSYFLDIDIKDLEQLLANINRSEESKTIDYYKKKYCPLDKWSRFSGCCMYFYIPANCPSLDWEALLQVTMKRMKLEVCFNGGKVTNCISNATHFVVMSLPGFNVDFNTILKSFSPSERRFIRNTSLHLVNCQWLEDCFEKDQILQEEEYSLRPSDLSESTLSDEHALETETLTSLKEEDKNEKKKTVNVEVPSLDNDGRKRKGRQPKARVNTRRKTGPTQPRRTRARSGNKAVKIHEYVSDEDEEASADESYVKLDDEEKHHELMQDDTIVEDTEPLEKGINDTQITTEYVDNRDGDGDDDKNNYNNRESDKLEIMVDPVQAMLLDMIPSLEPRNKETPVSDPPATKMETPSLDPNPNHGPDPGPGPSKKKKVSYRDLAMDWLKD
ncbi:DNA ligase 4 [Helianthus annuus]|uniref:DNA ligase 4 n=1 Tax=Helianthus annuus TaxID=4232 RepID=UPI000B8F3E84|nr:DNA ligase 4 [Helianthus annuus]